MKTHTTELAIVIGVSAVPDDALSVEEGTEELSLIDGVRGFALAPDGWFPSRPQTKNNGIWADNPTADGRIPVAFADGNVVETMQLTATAPSLQNRDWLLGELDRYRRAVQQAMNGGKKPVYLRWWAVGAPGPQYALIYNMDIAGGRERFEGAQTLTITITLEREPFWTPIPPGASPKQWTCEVNGVPFTAANASLCTGTDHLVYGTVYNKQEFNTLYTLLTRNFIDIPADKIPGDAPALVCIAASSGWGYTWDTFIAKSTNRASILDRNGNPLPLYNVLAASGSSLQSVTAAFSTSATYGVVHKPRSANADLVAVTPVNTSETLICFWTTGAPLYPHLNPTVLRGTYAVFVRAYQAGGTYKQSTIRLEFESSAGVFFDSGKVFTQVQITGASHLHSMGIVTLPPDDHSSVGARGKGLQVEYDFRAKLYVQRTAGTSTIGIIDVILMPIHEGFVQIKPELYLWSPTYDFYDNTGYFTHGKREAIGTARYLPEPGNEEYTPLAELLGGELTLTPGVDNRLYFLFLYRGTDPPESGAGRQSNVCINIIPRWIGVRDV